MGKKDEFPFEVDRALPHTLTRQLVDGFTRAIEFGVYKPGDSLPPFREVVARTGVSEIVVRMAYRKLAVAGRIVSRPRIGSVVLPQQAPVSRGHVLCVVTDFDFNFIQCGIVGRLRERLTEAGYLFSQVAVLRDRNRSLDLSGLEMALERPVDFIIQTSADAEVSRRLSDTEIPFVVIGDDGVAKELAGCVGIVGISCERALQDFVKACRKERVSTVEIVCCERLNGLVERLMKSLDEIGISASARWLEGVPWGVARTEGAERKGHEFIVRTARRRGFRWPDLYFVTDDYVARGMLMAFAEIGVRLPDDVRFVCVAQSGFRPVCGKTLAAIERNPYADGKEVAQRVLACLDQRRPFPHSPIEARFVPGETFA